MKETIAAIRIRQLWNPPLDSYSAPHAGIKITCQPSFDQGWNAAVAYYKAVGKI